MGLPQWGNENIMKCNSTSMGVYLYIKVINIWNLLKNFNAKEIYESNIQAHLSCLHLPDNTEISWFLTFILQGIGIPSNTVYLMTLDPQQSPPSKLHFLSLSFGWVCWCFAVAPTQKWVKKVGNWSELHSEKKYYL